jgi:hypothetical protein
LIALSCRRGNFARHQPIRRVWKEALASEAIIESFVRGDSFFEYSPIALMCALLVQTWGPCGAKAQTGAFDLADRRRGAVRQAAWNADKRSEGEC